LALKYLKLWNFTKNTHIYIVFWRKFVQNLRINVNPKFFSAEMDFCSIDPCRREDGILRRLGHRGDSILQR
jgi:hypothetical protein